MKTILVKVIFMFLISITSSAMERPEFLPGAGGSNVRTPVMPAQAVVVPNGSILIGGVLYAPVNPRSGKVQEMQVMTSPSSLNRAQPPVTRAVADASKNTAKQNIRTNDELAGTRENQAGIGKCEKCCQSCCAGCSDCCSSCLSCFSAPCCRDLMDCLCCIFSLMGQR